MSDSTDRRRITPTKPMATLFAILILSCSSAEISPNVHLEPVDLDEQKALSPGSGSSPLAEQPAVKGTQTDDEASESNSVELDNRAFASVAELCANFVAQAKAGAPALLESVSGVGIDQLKSPYCTAIAEPHPVPANPSYERSVTLRLSNGLWERKQLAVKLSRGFVLFPSYWDADDPTDPGCPSLFRAESIEPLRVENGYLVVVESGRSYLEMNEEGAPTFTMIHGATWCKESGGTLTCRRFEPTYSGSLDVFSIAPDGTLHTPAPSAP